MVQEPTKINHVDYVVHDENFNGKTLSSAATFTLSRMQANTTVAVVKGENDTQFFTYDGTSLVPLDATHFTSHIFGIRNMVSATKHSSSVQHFSAQALDVNGNSLGYSDSFFTSVSTGYNNSITLAFSKPVQNLKTFRIYNDSARGLLNFPISSGSVDIQSTYTSTTAFTVSSGEGYTDVSYIKGFSGYDIKFTLNF